MRGSQHTESACAGVAAAIAAAGPEAEIAVAARLIETGQTWTVAGDQPFPAASTIKAAILVALYRAVEAGRLDLAQEVAVDPTAKVPGSGVLTWLRDGLRLPVADLAYVMIAISDNTASNLLLDLVGLERVRETIADLGLTGTALNRRFLGRAPGPGEPDNRTTAADLAALFAAIASNRAASAASCAAMRATFVLQQPGTLPGLVHDAGLVTTPRGTLALAVLTRGIADPWQAEATIGEIARAAVAGAELIDGR